MEIKKNIGKLLIIAFFIGITLMFFTYPVTITYDSSHYLWLSTLLSPQGEFSTWDVARGIVFPLFIRTCTVLFGQSSNGLITGMYIFYLIMLFGCYLIYKDTIKDEEEFKNNKILKWIFGIFFFIFVVVNPMIIGYYHSLLTEFMAITFSIIGCYVAWKWIDVSFSENKIKYILLTLGMAIFTAIAWQLKQPYVTTILFPVIIAGIIAFIKQPSLKNFLQRIITIICCMIIMFIGMSVWNTILKNNNVNIVDDRTSASFLASGIIGGLNEYCPEESKQVKTSGEAIGVWLSAFTKQPIDIIKNYMHNYLAVISVHDIEFVDGKILITKNIDLTDTVEIGVIGFKMYEHGNECVFPLSEVFEPYAEPYKTINKPVVAINWVMRRLELPTVFVMKIVYMLLPILLIISIVFVFRTKKRYNEKYNKITSLIAVLYTYSFLHILMHAVLGATIDRYSLPALATSMIAIMLNIYVVVFRKKYKIENNKNEKETK